MPYAPHIRATALCDVLVSGVPSEIVQYGISLSSDSISVSTGNPSDDAIDLMEDTAQDFRTFHTSAAMSLPAEVVLSAVKFAKITADGTYAEEPYIVELATSPGAGGGVRHALQTSLVVSLTTDRRGPSGKGRFYLPSPTWTIGDNWAYNAGDLPNARAAAATFLNSVNDAPNLDVNGVAWTVVVASTKGYNTPVTGVRIGNLPDTQRRRRNGLSEAYNAPTPVS